ncbi:hypothetical protein AAE478_004973 [Parahypoxylon ruwenzoriense]
MEAMSMDPSQRKLLEVTFEAFDNAGEPFEKFYGSRTGVFVGNFNNEHQLMQYRDPDHTLPYVVTGGGPTILSNRINYVFNLQGPSLMVDTACSASMYALHMAVLSLRNGDCDAAIVAGGNIILGPDNQIFTTKLGAVSPTSRCHTFDASADGYARAEGFGALYLKKLSDALRQGNPIRAVVRGTAFNANGKTGGISHPSVDGQEAVIRQAYKAAGDLDPDSTGYFECHGTGTPVGDPIEVSALGRVFASGRQEQPLLIGSIKPNLGHSEAASALSQIMKAILALEHGEIPATIGIKTFNPAIDFEEARAKVVTKMTPWPRNLLRRVSINSFGYGGANAHCVIDHPSVVIPEYRLKGLSISYKKLLRGLLPSNGRLNGKVNGNQNGHIPTNGAVSVEWCRMPKLRQCEQAGVRSFVLIPFSAHDDQALKASFAAMSDNLSEFDLSDLLYTLGARKSKLSHRAFFVSDSETLGDGLKLDSMFSGKTSSSPMQRIGFVFTGQGAQWPEMGAKLIQEYAAFRLSIRYLDDVLGHLQEKPTWKIEDVLQEPPDTSPIHTPAFSQTICTALQIALVNLLRQWGIQPVVTVGHSSGEIAAAYAAGRLRASEAIVLAYCRGKVVATNQRKGLMIAVGLGPDRVLPYLHDMESSVRIAAVNSPDSTTISGDPEAIKSLAAKLIDQQVFNRILKTGDNAYHSHHMLSLGEPYEELASEALRQIQPVTLNEPARPAIKWISSVSPEKNVRSILPAYWRSNLESPVFFSQAIQVLARDVPVDLLIEVGPHPALDGPLKQIRSELKGVGSTLPACLPSLRRGGHDIISMLKLAGDLFLNDAPVDLVAVNATEKIHHGEIILQHGYPCVDMPQYKFTYPEKPVYYENRFNKEFRTRKHLRHDLLGARQPGCSKTHPSWRNVLRMKDLHWLDDHKLIPHAVLPGAAYISMAIEAVTQMHYEVEDASPIRSFKLRNIAINSTLQVKDSDLGVETVLNMERVALTNANVKSVWYKFNIGSTTPDSGIWTEHCSGTISAETKETTLDETQRLRADARSRSLDIKRWYEKFAEVGLGYGPTFRGLSNLRAYHGANIAAADVALNPTSGTVDGGESKYALHPATLDTCLQLAIISCHAGQVENVGNAFVPVAIKDLSIWVSNSPEEKGWGVASGNLLGLRAAYARAQLYSASGAPLMDMNELRCVTYDGVPDAIAASKLTREPYWRSVARVDIDTLTDGSAKAMFPSASISPSKLEAFDLFSAYVLANIEIELDKYATGEKVQNHDKFAAWIRSWVPSSVHEKVLGISAEERTRAIDDLALKLYDFPEVRCIQALHNNLSGILGRDTNSIKLLMEGNLLQELYTSGLTVCGAYAQLRNTMDLLTHKSSKMRILEIGAGTGGAAAIVLDTLKSNTSFKRFQEYVFTDPASWCLSDAQTKFSGYNGVSFQNLSIQDDPITQGFQPHSFDMVIAAHSLGHVENTPQALKHIHSLLKPMGKLVVLETTHARLGLEILSRTLTGRWDLEQIFKSEAGWDQVLRDCGFSGTDLSLDDYVGTEAMSTLIVTKAITPAEGSHAEAKQQQHDVHLIYRDYPPPLTRAIEKELNKQGINTIFTDLSSHQEIPHNSSIISLVDVEDSTLLHRDDEYFRAIKGIITKSSTLIWVAGGDITNISCDPAVMKGILRSVATENMLAKIAFIEIEGSYLGSLSRTSELIAYKFSELQGSQSIEGVDRESTLRNGAFYVERLLPDEILNEQFRLRHGLEDNIQEHPIGDQGPLRANYKQPGLLSSLYFSSDPAFDETLKSDWVEIKTEAIGLNFKDLAVATARFDWDYLSTEAAGVVTQVGSAVTSIKPGDRVFGMMFGNMGNYMRSPASLISTIPDGKSFIGATSMPVVYLTSIYALRHLAHLEKGESVLIQSATGGLGMAAIHVARHLGAEIYATVGNDEKRNILIEEFGIPGNHIFNSRDINSIDEVMQATGGKGIDVILSSTGGDTMHETWRYIAPLGRFIDVGRTDVLGGGKLGLEVFKRNATFSSFDMAVLYGQRPAMIEKLMKELKSLWDSGVIGPIDHITTFDISQLESAMSFFSKGLHTGKLVITFEDPKTTLKIAKTCNRASFDPNATYVLIGCLGGLGRSLAVWMVDRGARHLVFLSRSGAEKTESALLMKELITMGADPEVIRCSVTDRDALVSAIEQISKHHSVKGVIHAAMVEGDAFFNNSSYSQIHAVLAPKVAGTINLHHATKHLPLDFFLMTSSIIGSVGTPTQAAYTAANTFQDSFARWRQAQSLPATSIQLGLILEVGSVSSSPAFQQMVQRNATYGMSETEFLQLLEGALCQSSLPPAEYSSLFESDPTFSAQIITGLEPARFIPYVEDDRMKDMAWHNNARFQSVMQAISDRAQARALADANTSGSGSSVSQRLSAVSTPAEKTAIAREAVVERLAKLLSVAADDIDVNKPMSRYGLDSLVAADLRNWLMKTFGTEVTLIQLLSKATKVEDLARLVTT